MPAFSMTTHNTNRFKKRKHGNDQTRLLDECAAKYIFLLTYTEQQQQQ